VRGQRTASPPPLRVLIVTPRFAPDTGGVEQHVAEVGRRLVALGCRVCVLTTDREGALPEVESIDGLTLRRVRAWPRNRDFYFAPGIFRAVAASRGKWDIVHIQSYHTFVAPLAMLGARRATIPYVVTFHGGGHSSPARGLMRRVQWRVLAPLMRRAAALIAIARFEIELYGSAFGVSPDRFELISNGVDVPSVKKLPPPDDGLIASVGRLERYKGHQRVIAALPSVLAKRPEARLWIAGTGPFEQELRRQAEALGIAGRVEIRAVPPDERERMAQEIARAALVVLMSEYETQPLAVLEAVALGRPVLVADTSGMSELAERALAVAIPLESPPGRLAEAIVEQLESPHQPPPTRLPTWDDCAGELLHLYRRVLSEDGVKTGSIEP